MMHATYIRRAIALAERNIDAGGGPFGAVIVKDGQVIAEASNQVTVDNDPTAHAEIVAIREAGRKLNNYDLTGCVIYTSCEPCPMCLGAIYWARISAVWYASERE
ncbi:MAG: nucleoside deaminase, partial [Bacteroidales bacterium]|nr:nucleoside deaminase [Bacteroidales bacterium]